MTSPTTIRVCDDLRELTAVFAHQLNDVRQRIALLRGRRDRAARREQRMLLEQEAAWQLGIVLLRRGRDEGVGTVIDLLTRAGEGSHPLAQVCASMATMIAIHRVRSTAAAMQLPCE